MKAELQGFTFRAKCSKQLDFVLPLIISCMTAASWQITLGPESDHSIPIWIWPLALLLAAICFHSSRKFIEMKDCPEKRAGWIFSFLLILFQLIGRQFDFPALNDTLSSGGPVRWLRCVLCACGFSFALGWPAAALMKRIDRNESVCLPPPLRNGRFFAGCLLLLMLLWLPCHLAYFPALMEYDSGYQLWQSWNHVYDASNPLFHTFILGFFYLTGEQIATVNAGVAVLSFLQQFFMAACLAWALTIIRKNGASQWIVTLCLLFFGTLPVFGMMSISMTKDVPFYCLVLVQLTLIFDGCRHPENNGRIGYWAALTGVTVMTCLFRANVLASMFLIPLLICPVCRDRLFRRRLFCFLLGGTTLAWGLNAVMVSAVQATPAQLRESLNVPIIQLARTSSEHEEVREDLTMNQNDLVSMPMTYIPYVADLSKWGWTLDTKNLGSFLKVWAHWGSVYPIDYTDAALILSKGYWYIWDRSYAKVYGEDCIQHSGVIPSRISAGIGTIRETRLLPDYYAQMEYLYSENHYQEIPGYRLLFNPAVYVWMMLFAAICAVCKKRWDIRMPARAGCLYLLGLLLGPCCILRYALLYMMLSPILICMLTTKSVTKFCA